MSFLVATNVVASRPPERRPTGTLHARANIFSWLPFSVFCMLTEIFDLYDNSGIVDPTEWLLTQNMLPESMIVAYLLCHLVGVSSACTNPVLYGLLNSNFLRNATKIIATTKPQLNSQHNIT